MANLLSKDGIAMQNFMENTSEENLNIYFNDETSLIYGDPENATTKGEVIQTNARISSRTRENFIKQLTNFSAYRNLPPIQRMYDPEKIVQIRRKMKPKEQNNDDNERG